MLKINVSKLESERERMNESQEKFAARLGIKQTTYSAIVNKATTTFKTLTSIADALHIDPLDLLISE